MKCNFEIGDGDLLLYCVIDGKEYCIKHPRLIKLEKKTINKEEVLSGVVHLLGKFWNTILRLEGVQDVHTNIFLNALRKEIK